MKNLILILLFLFPVSVMAQIDGNQIRYRPLEITATSYAITNQDRGRAIIFCNTSPIAVTIGRAGLSGNYPSGWYVHIKNRCAGTVTLTPTTSNVDGTTSITLTNGQGVQLLSNGSNYRTEFNGTGTSGGGGGDGVWG